MISIAILQPYVPEYRVPFFSQLGHALAKKGIELHVLADRPTGQQAERLDASPLPSWASQARGLHVHLGKRTLTYVQGGRLASRFEALVLPLEGTSLTAYDLIMRRKRGRLRVGLWGHVAAYIQPANKLDLALERWQMRNADHVFAYTPMGALAAAETGVSEQKITTVMNSVDVSTTLGTLSSMRKVEIEAFAKRNNLASKKVIGYIGGLDSSKRIDFIAAALDTLWNIDREITLVVAGAGRDLHLLDRAVARGQVVYLGYGGPAEKARIAASASYLWMPGRIGLLAVEALALKLPILTTDWPWHAPEADYLREGISRFTLSDSPASFAAETAAILSTSPPSPDPADDPWEYPTLADMTSNFAAGVFCMLE